MHRERERDTATYTFLDQARIAQLKKVRKNTVKF